MDLSKIEVKKDLKVIFMGTPLFAVPILSALIENYKVRAVVTQPDKVIGRDKKIAFSPIKRLANENSILVLQPSSIKDSVDEIKELDPDLIVTCAYGQILPKALLDIPRLGCINVHASLLPKLRGGAPIQRAIMKGHLKSGISIMYMDVKMDAGDIISQREVDILDSDTGSMLHDKLSAIGTELLLETLPSIISGTNERVKQIEEDVTYGYIITRNDEKISFKDTTKLIHNQVRALNAWPGAYAILSGKNVKIWETKLSSNVFSDKYNGEITAIYKDGIGVKTGNGEIILTSIQMEGKNRVSAVDFANGHQDLVGKVFS
ncbi:MAG: methionyl-tRNA formyltransferase [Mycoplasmatota bacterium]